jgi:hypothetical protein
VLDPKKTQHDLLLENIATAIEFGPLALVEKGRTGRSPIDRRKYVGHPAKYVHDVLGWRLTPNQDEFLQYCEEYDRVLAPAGNNTGKTFLLGCYGIYRFDAVASIPDEERGLDEQGAQLLLPGPDHNTIFNTIYNSILEHASRAEQRGFELPGDRSERSVHWRVRPRWHIEAFAPSFRTEQEVSHSASGRHHKNQVALIEEGQGVEEALWKAVEGMCSSEGNKIISAFNPTEASGPAYQRALSGGFKVFHINAFDHRNVRKRMVFISDAISYKVIDTRVRTECRDRGEVGVVSPDEQMGDFVYALPPSLDSEESGPRDDGHLGHPLGDLHVYRPSPQFEAQVLGQWPKTGSVGLFDPGAWDKAVMRWKEYDDPEEVPDCVGVDVARDGDDETCVSEMWGEDVDDLLKEFFRAKEDGDINKQEEMRRYRRIRVGKIVTVPRGDGPEVAQAVYDRWSDSPIQVDETGVGSSVLDHLKHVLEADVTGVSFGAGVKEQLPGEPIFENTRVAMYFRAAELIRLGLLDPPEDHLLREELMVHELEHRFRVVNVSKRKKVRKPSIKLIEKDKIKKQIGRSPDRADAFVLSLWRGDPEPRWNIF